MKTPTFNFNVIFFSILLMSIVSSCNPPKTDPEPNSPAKLKTCGINLYIENSASMYGYVDAGTGFADNISNLLADLKLSGMVSNDSTISCHYINSAAFKVKKTYQNCLKDMKTDIKNSAFGKNKGTTHIDKLIQDVLSKTNDSSLSILVSDMILSPGQQNDASQFMTSTRNNISSLFSTQTDKAAILFHCVAPYSGLYYNHVDATRSIKTSRPYYILVVGNLSLIKEFLAKQANPNRRFTAINSVSFFNYDLVTTCRINHVSTGNILKNKNSIQDAKLDNGKFQLSVAVDLSEILEDKAYITDINNWSTNTSRYGITNIKEQKGVNQTHIITVKTNHQVNKQLLKLSLKRTDMPQWVKNTTIDAENASRIFDDSYLDKTFGLQEIVEGIYDGYYYNKSDNYAELKVQIN